MSRVAVRFAFLLLLAAPARAQDVRGIEICTVEKQVERRTSCLQSNIDFLQQKLTRMEREAQEKLSAAQKENAALKQALAELKSAIAGLKDAHARAEKRVEDLEKTKADKSDKK